jgi:hypothetical protein
MQNAKVLRKRCAKEIANKRVTDFFPGGVIMTPLGLARVKSNFSILDFFLLKIEKNTGAPKDKKIECVTLNKIFFWLALGKTHA